MSLYADENFPLPVVQVLRQLGHDVLTIGEAGEANQQYSDAAVLQDAAGLNRCVLTLNRKHFRQRMAKRSSDGGSNHAGPLYTSDHGVDRFHYLVRESAASTGI